MKVYAYDCEVFSHDWIVVFKDIKSKETTVFHNDRNGLNNFITDKNLYGGFNSKHYDQYIIKAILIGGDNHMVKEINDWIIGGELGFKHWFIRRKWLDFNNFDVRDDMQMGLSLKAIEGHLGMNIEESEVPFDIDRPLTKEELKSTTEYCIYDVKVTAKLIQMRKDYLNTKVQLGKEVGISIPEALSLTNGKLTATYLGADPAEYKDERFYYYPPNLNKDNVPQEVFDFFDQMSDFTISDDELFKSKIEVEIADGVAPTYAFGGIHYAIPKFRLTATDDLIIRNYDVASLYPSLIINYGYSSRNIKDVERYESTYHRRLKAKAEGDTAVSNNLKLVLNTTYGCLLNKYNNLYDPKQGRSICITGQLLLTDLAVEYLKRCETVEIIQINTDGIMISLNRNELTTIHTINKEWEGRTLLELEEESIKTVAQKDVNNYIVEFDNGKILTKGGYVTYGISPFGSWNINNNMPIVPKAIIEYLAHGVPVEETVMNSKDIFDFQIIAKAGSKYTHVYHEVDGKQIATQKVNRVYAIPDEKFGTLYKVHAKTKRPAKIASLPANSIIDNDNQIKLEQIDRQWYIDLAIKRIKDYIGAKKL